MAATKVIKPQEGPQEQFLSSPADIVIYGGAAGGGKTWGMLMEGLRHIGNPRFGAVFFRRTTTQIRNEGGLWDESAVLYPDAGGRPREHVLEWVFPSGAKVSFAHLQHDKTILEYQGSQIPLLLFDELTHFTAKQFWYMLSRNRSMSGVKPYVRASCNPDADSWVADFIAWWIDQKTGYAIPERSGAIRYFVRIGDRIVWADDPRELAGYTAPNENGEDVPIVPKSVTFISSKLTDNKALMSADPSYMANLMALPTVERERLLGGNWKIRPAAGLYFKREWCDFIDHPPEDAFWCRGWDLASTPKTEANDPDATSGTLVGKMPDGRYVVAHNKNGFLSPSGVKSLLKSTAEGDSQAMKGSRGYMMSIPQDPGAAGKAQKSDLSSHLNQYDVRFSPETGSKVTRFSPFSAQAQAGNVLVVRGNWNESWFRALEGFPEAAHDDDADSTARAYNALNEPAAAARVFVRSKRKD